MRKLAAAVLAVPVIALLYVPVILRRSVAARLALAIGVGGVIGVAAIGALAPARTSAIAPRHAAPVPTARFTTDLRVNQSPSQPVAIEFSAPMDRASVLASLSVAPAAPVTLSWDATGRRVSIQPSEHWSTSTYYTVTVGREARDAGGQALGAPARAAFVVRPPAIARLSATAAAGARVRLDSLIALDFDRPVDVASIQEALTIEPAVKGTIDVAPRRGAADHVVFRPAAPLAPDTTYTLRLRDAARDAEGAPVAVPSALRIRTVKAPAVVRFRPVDGATAIGRAATLSVRFTLPMERASTEAAFSAKVGGKRLPGSVEWAERDTVLVFDPADQLAYDTAVRIVVGGAARSKSGAPLGTAQAGVFRTEARPPAAPKPAAKAVSKPVARPSSGASGAAVGSGAWAAVETYYLRLMNCTRTGGWITSGGSCSSPGGRSVAGLRIDPDISNRVSRPYAKLLATRGICSHFADGNPGTRLRRAGYSSYRWAENIGCRSGNAFNAVLGSHLFYQSERPYSGGHYVNLMNAAYDRVGIGVWVASGRVRIVIDFYHP